LSARAFRKLVRIVAGRGGKQTGTDRGWGLSLADRVLLVALYYRTNLRCLGEQRLMATAGTNAAHLHVAVPAPVDTSIRR
jgi:hypothetical protein